MTKEQLLELLGSADDDLILRAHEAVSSAQSNADAVSAGQTAAPFVKPLPLDLKDADRVQVDAGRKPRHPKQTRNAPSPVECESVIELEQKQPSRKRLYFLAAAFALLVGLTAALLLVQARRRAASSAAQPAANGTAASDDANDLEPAGSWGTYMGEISPDPIEKVQDRIQENEKAINAYQSLLNHDPIRIDADFAVIDPDAQPQAEPEPTPGSNSASQPPNPSEWPNYTLECYLYYHREETREMIEALREENRRLLWVAYSEACEALLPELREWTIGKLCEKGIALPLDPADSIQKKMTWSVNDSEYPGYVFQLDLQFAFGEGENDENPERMTARFRVIHMENGKWLFRHIPPETEKSVDVD